MKAYVLKLSFNDIQPAVWRQFIMPENATFKRLFDALMCVTNFDGSHLFKFEAADLIVTNDDELLKVSKRKSYDGKPVKSATAKIDTHVAAGMTFTYDFGDNWTMTLQLERTVEDYYFGYPTLLAMQGEAPLENVGGAAGFQQYKKAMSDVAHPQFLAMHEWTDRAQTKPRHFDEMNERLKQVKYQKTDWSMLAHTKYVLTEDAYRRAEGIIIDRVQEPEEVATYIAASANLYGYLPLYKFLAIYNEQHTQMITASDVEAVAMTAPYNDVLKQAKATVYMDAIVHAEFDATSNNEQFFSRSFGKPYYVPTRKTFVKYVDAAYVEETPAITTLRKLLEQDLGGQSSLTDKLMADLLQRLKSETNFSQTVKQFIAHVPMKSTVQLNIYIELITNVANSMRLWINRGYTPTHLSSFEKGLVVHAKETVATATKVGRNDPCTCGSGKKFKKCCAK